MDMKKLTQVSLLNTIRFNLRYFKWGGGNCFSSKEC